MDINNINQSYNEILKEINNTNQKFFDEQFPPNENTLIKGNKDYLTIGIYVLN